MATLLTPYTRSMTNGERRLAQRLEEKLEDDYFAWYDVPIGQKGLRPDFILLHPIRGLIILEVKDWKLTTIQQLNRKIATLLTPDGEKKEKNPLEQARRYTFAVKELLERDRLLQQVDGQHKGSLAFPYGYGVVLTNINRAAFEAELAQAIEPHLVICKDEMLERVDAGEFQKRLWDLCSYQFGEPLVDEQIKRVRWHLFPDLRPIAAQQLTIFDAGVEDEPESSVVIPDIIQMMDLQQEQLARCLGEGNRVIHGVAGSGKTLILAYRCQQLAEEMKKPVLVLCFNVPLAARLRQMLYAKGLQGRVVVRHFHGWCDDLLRAHKIEKPSWNQFPGDAYLEELVGRVGRSIETGIIPDGQYGAVMVDEAHDFQPDWLKLVVKMVDPETNSLLVLYDDAQNLYGGKRKQKINFKRVGIQAQGRTTILKLNYRNTAEVLGVAYEFAKEFLVATGTVNEDEPILVKPQSAGRHGAKPTLTRFTSFRQETEALADRIQHLRERGVNWNEMAVVYRSKFMGESISQRLQDAQIPVEWVSRDRDSRDYNPTELSVKLITMHSSKGLEFPVVFIPGLGFLPNAQSTPEEEARLLYVAMTRAIDRLVLSCDRSSDFVARVDSALSRVTG